MAAADREWQGATGAVAERMGALQGLLEDNLADSTPAVELQRLLASGALSPSLHQFLTSMLGAAPAAEAALCRCLRPDAQQRHAAQRFVA